MLESSWDDSTRSMAGRSLSCFRFDVRMQRSFVDVVITSIGVVGKSVWYVMVYFATCRP